VTERAVPVVIAGHVAGVAGFYEALGFVRHFQFPPEGEPGYVGLRRGASELAVVAAEWPQQQYGRAPAPECVRAVRLRRRHRRASATGAGSGGTARAPADMPWGERVGYVTDPEGNPVALAAPYRRVRPRAIPS